MNYIKIYDSLMQRAQGRFAERFVHEKHHIVPKCMGGSNDLSNIVALTYQEHYIAHKLLMRRYPLKLDIVSALIRMSTKKCKTSRGYALRKAVQSKRQSDRSKEQWNDPTSLMRTTVRDRSHMKTPEHRKLKSEQSKLVNTRPEVKAAKSKAMKKQWESEEYKQLRSQSAKEKMKAWWAIPANKEKRLARLRPTAFGKQA
jgi:hypothetical protein